MAAVTASVSSLKHHNGIKQDKFSFLFSAVPTGEIATYALRIPAGLLLDIRVKTGATAFNSLTVTVTDELGVTILAGTITASGIVVPTNNPIPFVGQLSIALSGNTTANALGTISVHTKDA